MGSIHLKQLDATSDFLPQLHPALIGYHVRLKLCASKLCVEEMCLTMFCYNATSPPFYNSEKGSGLWVDENITHY